MSDILQARTDELITRSQAWRAANMPPVVKQPTMSGELLQSALDHARKGYYIHPLVPKDKMPLAGGHGYHDATRDEATIRDWWEATPNANVGINLARSGIVDIAPDSVEWTDRFKAKGLPYTTAYSSGGGPGHGHRWYRLPTGGPVARACVKGQYDVMSEGNAVAPGSIHPSGRAYVLYTKLLPVEDLPLAPDWAIELLQQHVKVGRKEHNPEAWLDLPSGAVLAHSRRFQALCKANDQLRMVVAGEAVTLTLKSGGQDSSPSIQRSVFVNQLLRAKYPHDEIRALALHFSGVLESKPKWFKADIDRILDIYTPKNYSPESTGMIALALRGGRHYEITTDELLNAYHQHATVGVTGSVLEWTVNEAAARLKVSTGTIKRREAELIADGKIRRDYGRVILSPATWQNRSQCTVTPQTADEIKIDIVNLDPIEAETVYKNTIGSQFVSPQQDAVNAPDDFSCNERAHAEITHPPGGDLPAPNRDLLAFVRSLAGAAAEPGWFLRDYAGWSNRVLQDEADRLGAILDATDDGEALHADIAAEHWKRTTREGRHYAQMEARNSRDLANVERLHSVLLGPPGRAGECVLSISAMAQEAFYANA